jgi:hypothetical protein
MFAGRGMMPRSWPSRVVYLTSYVLGYVLVAAYSAALVSFLAVQREELPFTNFKGLLEDGTYEMGVTKGAEVAYFRVSSSEFVILGQRVSEIYQHNVSS